MERNKMFVWFNKNNNFKSHFRTSKMQLEIKKPKCSYLGDPLRVHFNTRCDHAEEHQKQPYSVSRAFALVFCWYKVIIALLWSFSSGALQHTVHSSIIAVKIVSLKLFFTSSNISVWTWGSLEQKQQYLSGQYKMQTVDCRLQTGCKMQTENYTVFSSDTCLLTTYRASRNRFSVIISHDYYPLARFLITIVLNIISSLHIVFSLCARVGWCDVCTECTN